MNIVLPKCIDDLEEAFIRCHALERREPGGGRWPFAGDGPWSQMQGEVGDVGAADYSITLLTNEAGRVLEVRKLDSREPRTPLDAGEVGELKRLRGWLLLVPACEAPFAVEHDRKLVWLATAALHRGEGRVPWKALCGQLRSPRSPQALVGRYRKAMASAVCMLNEWPQHWVRRMAA